MNAWSNPLWPFGPSSRCSSKFDGSGDSTHPTRVASASLSWRPVYAAKLGIEGSKNSDTSTKGTDPFKVRLNCGLDMLEYCAIPVFFSTPCFAELPDTVKSLILAVSRIWHLSPAKLPNNAISPISSCSMPQCLICLHLKAQFFVWWY